MSVDARLAASTAVRPGTEAEFSARALRPVAHWVVMEGRLTCVWEVPDPMPFS